MVISSEEVAYDRHPFSSRSRTKLGEMYNLFSSGDESDSECVLFDIPLPSSKPSNHTKSFLVYYFKMCYNESKNILCKNREMRLFSFQENNQDQISKGKNKGRLSEFSKKCLL